MPGHPRFASARIGSSPAGETGIINLKVNHEPARAADPGGPRRRPPDSGRAIPAQGQGGHRGRGTVAEGLAFLDTGPEPNWAIPDLNVARWRRDRSVPGHQGAGPEEVRCDPLG